MKIEITSNIKEIDKKLKKYWGNKSDKSEPQKPEIKVIFISCKEKNEIGGFIYALDINDGYFRECIIDEMTIKEKDDKKCMEELLKKLIIYCKKEKIDLIVDNLEEEESEVFKKLGFDITNQSGVFQHG